MKVMGKHRAWKSFRQALKAVSSKEDIDDIMRRLLMFRQQLEFRVMVSFVYVKSLHCAKISVY